MLAHLKRLNAALLYLTNTMGIVSRALQCTIFPSFTLLVHSLSSTSTQPHLQVARSSDNLITSWWPMHPCPLGRTACRHGMSTARPSGHTHVSLSMSRRAAAHSALNTLGWVALAGGGLAVAGLVRAAVGPAADPRQQVNSGMAKFRKNEIEAAVADFDAAWQAAPQLRPFLWQRGLALYYIGRYKDAAQQFRSDVAVNPSDTEEAIWAFISEARVMGPEAARAQFLEVGRDSRPIMRAAYDTFQSGAGPEKIEVAITDDAGGTCFYGQLYIALWHESHGSLQEPLARTAMEAACATQYARTSGDYMASLARTHCKQRGWTVVPEQ